MIVSKLSPTRTHQTSKPHQNISIRWCLTRQGYECLPGDLRGLSPPVPRPRIDLTVTGLPGILRAFPPTSGFNDRSGVQRPLDEGILV